MPGTNPTAGAAPDPMRAALDLLNEIHQRDIEIFRTLSGHQHPPGRCTAWCPMATHDRTAARYARKLAEAAGWPLFNPHALHRRVTR